LNFFLAKVTFKSRLAKLNLIP